jgi:hypothetical protein
MVEVNIWLYSIIYAYNRKINFATRLHLIYVWRRFVYVLPLLEDMFELFIIYYVY